MSGARELHREGKGLIGLQHQLLEQDLIRDRRRRVRPLGWLLIFVLLLFLLALCAALTRWVTHNVSELPATPTSPQYVHADQTYLVLNPIPSPTAPLCAATPITWTVTAAQNASGATVYAAPTAVQNWVIANYLESREWAEQNKFDLETLRAHLSDYFVDEALTQASAALDDLAETHTFISAGTPQLLAQRRQIAFDASGRQATISSYLAASTNVQFDISSQQRIGDGDHLPNRLLVEEIKFDVCAGRWKIARSRVVIDLTTDTVMWGQR